MLTRLALALTLWLLPGCTDEGAVAMDATSPAPDGPALDATAIDATGVPDGQPVDARPDMAPPSVDAAPNTAPPTVDAALQDAAPQDAAPQDAGPASVDCDALCAQFAARCAQTRWLLGECGRCAALRENVEASRAPRFQAAAAICAEALARQNCHYLGACLADDDGINAFGDDGVVSIERAEGRIEARGAIAVVGAKGGGGPSDLELMFTVDDLFYLITFDDLAADVAQAPLSAAENPVILATAATGPVAYRSGEVRVLRFARDHREEPAGYTLEADVARSPEEPIVRIRAVGTFR